MPLQQRLQLFCSYCKNAGHLETQCYSKQKNFQRGNSTNRPQDQVNQLQVQNTNKENPEENYESHKSYSQEAIDTEYLLSPDDYIQSEDNYTESEDQLNY